jgi:SAM-dependent methyltransferase
MTDFDRVADEYESLCDEAIGFGGRDHAFYLEAKARHLSELTRRVLGGGDVSALDVGCGTGAIHPYLRFAELVAVDPATKLIEAARRANPGVRYDVADGTNLPYEDARFDLVFAVCVLHHVATDARHRFALELARVARPGGVVAIFEHNPWNPLTRLAVSRCAFDEGVELLRIRETVHLLASADLDVTHQAFMLFVPWRAGIVDRALARVPLGAQYCVAGTANLTTPQRRRSHHS